MNVLDLHGKEQPPFRGLASLHFTLPMTGRSRCRVVTGHGVIYALRGSWRLHETLQTPETPTIFPAWRLDERVERVEIRMQLIQYQALLANPQNIAMVQARAREVERIGGACRDRAADQGRHGARPDRASGRLFPGAILSWHPILSAVTSSG